MKAFLTIILCGAMIAIGIFVNKKLSNIELSALKKEYAKVVAGKAVSDSKLITKISENVAQSKKITKLNKSNNKHLETIENGYTKVRKLEIELVNSNSKIYKLERLMKRLAKLKRKSSKRIAISRINTVAKEKKKEKELKKSRINANILKLKRDIKNSEIGLKRYANGLKSNSPKKVRARRLKITKWKLSIKKEYKKLRKLKNEYNSIK